MSSRFVPIALVQQVFSPAADTVRGYSSHKLWHDLLAGITVAVVAIPQAMAFALIAGVPPEYGLYTAIFQGILGAIFSSSEHLSSGPTNTQSLLILATVHRISGSSDPMVYVQLAISLTLLKGLIQLAFAAARMGNLVRYVSQSVIVGFTAGAGVLIALLQLPNFLGIQLDERVTSLPGALDKLARLWPQLGQVKPQAVIIGVSVLAVVLICRRIWRMLPGPLIAVGGAALAAYLMGWSPQQVPLIGPLPSNLPHFQLPHLNWSTAEEMLGGAIAIALLGLVESVAISKSIAVRSGQRINANQEFFSQGLSNVLTSFFQCIPGSGSFSRSALNYTAGAATRVASLFSALFIVVAYLLFSTQARYIPLASLAAILFIVAWHLIDFNYIRRIIRTSREDTVVCLITFLATLLMPLAYAIYIGIFLNIGLYLRQASRLHMAEMVRTQAGPFIERPITDRTGRKAVLFLQLEGDLFFGVADELRDRLIEVANSGVTVVIFRLKRTLSIDATILGVFQEFALTMQQRGGYVLLCGVKDELLQRIEHFGLLDIIGRDNVFPVSYGIFTSAKQALHRARQLVGTSIDTDGFSDEQLQDFENADFNQR